MTQRPFHYFLALAVVLWAHVCCCTPGQAVPSPAGAVAAAPGEGAERSCCNHRHHDQAPKKAPCKDPGSCGRCVEKNLGLSGETVTAPPSAIGLPVAPPVFVLAVVTAQDEPIVAAAPGAYTGTSLLRLHCALIV